MQEHPVLKSAHLIVLTTGLLFTLTAHSVGQETPPLTGDFAHQFVLADEPIAAPETSFTDESGQQVSLGSFGGEVVLLNFWATWCAPCVEEMPSLNRLQARLGGEGLRVLTVSVDEGGHAEAAPFLNRHGLGHLKAYTDPKSELMAQFGVAGIPTSFLIDADGKVAGVFGGATQWDSDDAIGLVRHYLDRRGDPSESFYALADTGEEEPETAADAYAQGDYATAFRMWRPAAEAGNPEAQFNLAVLYDLGLGVGEDKLRAAKWYAEAAERGYADASFNLAVMFVEGEGVPQDYVMAYLFFDLASDGDSGAAEPRDAVAAAMGPGLIDQAEDLTRRVRADGSGEVLRETLADILPKPGALDLVRRVQEGLALRGYDPGAADGVAGPKTRAAVLAFQEDTGLPANGEVSEALLTQLESTAQ